MTCLHEFVKVRRWRRVRRYHCRLCGLETRGYDSVDQMGMRPVHRRMSVAVRGMNVVEKDGTVPVCPHSTVVNLPTNDGGWTQICLRCGERAPG